MVRVYTVIPMETQNFAGSNNGILALTSDSVLNGTATAYVNVESKGVSYLENIPAIADDLVQISVSGDNAIALRWKCNNLGTSIS